MSVELSAPYPWKQTTTILPNPQWDDSVNLMDEVNVKRSSDGTMYTYVKRSKSRRRLVMAFYLTLHKGLELQAFLNAYYSSPIYLKDHLSAEWVGYAVGNPFEFDTTERGAGSGKEMMTIQLELEAVPLGQEQDL